MQIFLLFITFLVWVSSLFNEPEIPGGGKECKVDPVETIVESLEQPASKDSEIKPIPNAVEHTQVEESISVILLLE